MPSISIPLIAAGVGAVGGIASSVIGGSAAKSAAKTQATAADKATQVQEDMFNKTQANLAPYINQGGNTLAQLLKGIGAQPGGTGTGPLNAPPPAWNPTEAGLSQTPGYQFDLSQGLQSILNSKTATGGVGGGNTLQALMKYGTGLADSTYQTQFNDWLAQSQLTQSQQQQAFSQLFDVSQLGESAAAGQGQIGTQVGANIGSNIIGAGNATAAGQVGSANALTSGISGIGSNFLLAALLQGGGGGGALNLGTAGGLYPGGGDSYSV